MKNSKGLPVGIQVAALPFKEEEILDLMQIIETGVKFDYETNFE